MVFYHCIECVQHDWHHVGKHLLKIPVKYNVTILDMPLLQEVPEISWWRVSCAVGLWWWVSYYMLVSVNARSNCRGLRVQERARILNEMDGEEDPVW